MRQQLTVKEALEQGYRYYNDGSEYLQEIEDIDEEDGFPHGAILYDTLGVPVVNVIPVMLKEMLADWIYNYVGNRCDNESIADKAYKKMMAADFSDTANQINVMFESQLVYNETDIELIP